MARPKKIQEQAPQGDPIDVAFVAPEAQPAPAVEVAQPTQTHTYPDGSAVVGCPPWPEKSPMQRAREAAEGKA